MPKYVFECEGCSLKFERNLRMGDHPTHACPSCKGSAPQVMEGFGFAFARKEGAPIGNTGVHKDDYPTADQLVGRDADSRWETYNEKEKVKRQLRTQDGTHALRRKDGASYIEYQTLSSGERDARRKTAKQALQAMREVKERSR